MLRLLMLSGTVFFIEFLIFFMFGIIIIALENSISEETMNLLEKILIVIGILCSISLCVFVVIALILLWTYI